MTSLRGMVCRQSSAPANLIIIGKQVAEFVFRGSTFTHHRCLRCWLLSLRLLACRLFDTEQLCKIIYVIEDAFISTSTFSAPFAVAVTTAIECEESLSQPIDFRHISSVISRKNSVFVSDKV